MHKTYKICYLLSGLFFTFDMKVSHLIRLSFCIGNKFKDIQWLLLVILKISIKENDL